MDTSQATNNDKQSTPQKYWSEAEIQAKNALTEIKSQLSQDPHNVVLIMKWISSMQHLAEVYEARGDLIKAYYYLITPHNKIVDRLHDKALNEDEISITLSALSITFKPLHAYSLKHPCCDDCKKSLEEQRAWLEHSKSQLH